MPLYRRLNAYAGVLNALAPLEPMKDRFEIVRDFFQNASKNLPPSPKEIPPGERVELTFSENSPKNLPSPLRKSPHGGDLPLLDFWGAML